MIYSINEGQQAEEYKARKAKEVEDKKQAERERDLRRNITAYDKIHNKNQIDSKAEEIVNKESDRRSRPVYHHAYYMQQFQKDSESKLSDMNPGDRPTGIFKGKAQKQWDEDNKKYLDRKEEYRKDLERLNDKLTDLSKNNLRLSTIRGDAISAARRHISRHPKQYKESCGIFSSVAFI